MQTSMRLLNHVREFGIKCDREVLDPANREDRILVTFDKDFGELMLREKAKVKGLILLRFHAKSPLQIAWVKILKPTTYGESIQCLRKV